MSLVLQVLWRGVISRSHPSEMKALQPRIPIIPRGPRECRKAWSDEYLSGAGWPHHRKMLSHAQFEQPNKFGVHEVIIVGNIQTDNALSTQRIAEALLKLCPVLAFHHDDNVGPGDQFGR